MQERLRDIQMDMYIYIYVHGEFSEIEELKY